MVASHSARVAARTPTLARLPHHSPTPDPASLAPSARFGASIPPFATYRSLIGGPVPSTAVRQTAGSSATSMATLTFSTGLDTRERASVRHISVGGS